MLTVHLRINDAATAKPTPVRLRITDAAGTFFPPLGRFAEFATDRNEDVGGHLLLNGEHWCYIDGSCEVPLPSGVPLRIQATKGPEYTPLDETITLGAGQISMRFAIERWIDMRAKRWYSGDSRCHFLSPHEALLEAAAEALDVVNLLAVEQSIASNDGKTYRTAPNLTAFSGQTVAMDAYDRRIAVNTLNAHPVLGKVGLLYSHRPVFPLTFGGDETDDWSICDWCDQCHRKGGLTVWVDAFRETAGPIGGETLVAAILGKLDAIEITSFSQPLMEWIYRLWNAGFPIPLLGGSGKDRNTIPLGAMRTYAQLSPREPFTFKSWIEAVRAGRTFVTNGPLRVEEFEPVTGSGWRASRFIGPGGAFAHTSPEGVRVEETHSPEVDASLVRAVESTRGWIETLGRFEQPKRKQNLLDRCREALARLGATL